MNKSTIGIYLILNIKNGKYYIGSSVNIEGRWSSHRHHLRNGTHKNRYLQAAWNKYGEHCFVFTVIKKSSLEQLQEEEQRFLNTTQCFKREIGYNLSPSSENCRGIKRSPLTDSHKNKISTSLIKTFSDSKYKNNASSRMKARMSDPTAREKIAKESKTRWEDTHYKNDMINKHREYAQTSKGKEQLIRANQKRIESKKEEFEIISPSGEFHKIKNLAEFCRQNNLTYDSMLGASRQGRKLRNGWFIKKIIPAEFYL